MRRAIVTTLLLTTLSIVSLAEGDGDAENAEAGQERCPVLKGIAVDKDVFTKHEGQRVYFCCSPCKKKFKADPDKYLEKFDGKGKK